MTEFIKKVIAIGLVGIITLSQSALRAQDDSCPFCGNPGYITGYSEAYYPNASEAMHRVVATISYRCVTHFYHSWSGYDYQDEPHTWSGNTCTKCGYVGH